jgi:hypothetical protein
VTLTHAARPLATAVATDMQVQSMKEEGVVMKDLMLKRGPDNDPAKFFKRDGKKKFLPEIAQQRYKAHEDQRNEYIRLILERRALQVKIDKEKAEERERIRRRAIDALREDRRKQAIENDEWYDSDDSDELAALIKERPSIEEEKEAAYKQLLKGDEKFDKKRLQIAEDKMARHAAERRKTEEAQAQQAIEKIVVRLGPVYRSLCILALTTGWRCCLTDSIKSSLKRPKRRGKRSWWRSVMRWT